MDRSRDRGTTLPRRKDISLPSLEIIGGVSAAVESTKVPACLRTGSCIDPDLNGRGHRRLRQRRRLGPLRDEFRLERPLPEQRRRHLYGCHPPGFVVDPYKEYSQPWFTPAYKVLRGGCWATRGRLIRNTCRNFNTKDRRDVFAGFRTCALGEESRPRSFLAAC